MLAKDWSNLPKIYLRDSGLLHALLGIPDLRFAVGSPNCRGELGRICDREYLAARSQTNTREFLIVPKTVRRLTSFLELPRSQTWAIEIKRSSAPKLDRGLHHARDFLKPDRTFVVYSGQDRYPIGEGIEVVGLREICQELRSLA